MLLSVCVSVCGCVVYPSLSVTSALSVCHLSSCLLCSCVCLRIKRFLACTLVSVCVCVCAPGSSCMIPPLHAHTHTHSPLPLPIYKVFKTRCELPLN